MSLTSRLEIRTLHLDVHLGCTAEERSRPQDVDLDITVDFDQPPIGARSDRLEDTLCYAQVAAHLREVVAGREFNLVEHLGQCLFDEVRKLLPAGARLRLAAHKVNPPVDAIRGGVRFVLAD